MGVTKNLVDIADNFDIVQPDKWSDNWPKLYAPM
jgi:hypothetical protein